MIKNIIKTIILIFILNINNLHAVPLQDISIIITSCDKYSSLWEPFFELLFKNWPSLKLGGDNQHIPIFFISNNKGFEHPRVRNIKIPNEISWSHNMLKTLAQVDTKYVLYLQEDYFINNKVNENNLFAILNYAKKHDVGFIQISYFSKNIQSVGQNNLLNINNIDIREFDKYSQYKINLQASIWQTDVFSWLLKPGESIYDFEVAGSTRSEGMQKLFLADVNTSNTTPTLSYINAVGRGMQNIFFDVKQQSLPIDHNNKFIMFKMKISEKIIEFANKHQLSIKLKKIIKNIMF